MAYIALAVEVLASNQFLRFEMVAKRFQVALAPVGEEGQVAEHLELGLDFVPLVSADVVQELRSGVLFLHFPC
jgi:hypothetical protein